jgi:hypothetical protein
MPGKPREFPVRPQIKPAEVKVETEKVADLEVIILSVLKDSVEREVAEIANLVYEQTGKRVNKSEVADKCSELVSMGLLWRTRGRFYPKYKIKIKL